MARSAINRANNRYVTPIQYNQCSILTS